MDPDPQHWLPKNLVALFSQQVVNNEIIMCLRVELSLQQTLTDVLFLLRKMYSEASEETWKESTPAKTGQLSSETRLKGRGGENAQEPEGSAPAFICVLCSKSFSKQRNLRRHVLLHGTAPHPKSKERPFSCSLCGRCFADKYHLSRHALIHSGEKPHKCDVCGLSFRRLDGLRKHYKGMHLGSFVYVSGE